MLEISQQALANYPDVFTPEALDALRALAPFERDRRDLMAARLARRGDRAAHHRRIEFLNPAATIGRTSLTVHTARSRWEKPIRRAGACRR